MPSTLQDFTARILTRSGALVDHDQDGLVALLPPAVARELELTEYQRLSFDRRTAAVEAHVVDYDSPLVERLGRLIDGLGRVASVPPPAIALKAVDAEEVVTSAITFTNGIVRDCRAETGRAQYAGIVVHFELLADERVSGVTEVWVNGTTRSVPRHTGLMTQMLSSGAGAVDSAADGTAGEVRAFANDAWTSGAAAARRQVESRLADTFASLRRRRDRDFQRLREYYEEIDQEIRRRARRAFLRSDQNTLKAETSRLEATAQAFRGRVAELVDRYRVRVRLEPMTTVVSTLPAHLVTARIQRRSASRTIALTWNAFDRALELPACDGCGVAVTNVTLCDDAVHMLCPSCWSDCSTCGRPYCRACHAACPRQHR